jgi:hypothetical protein
MYHTVHAKGFKTESRFLLTLSSNLLGFYHICLLKSTKNYQAVEKALNSLDYTD